MKKTLIVICSILITSLFITGCKSNDNSVPPIYYDYGYKFDEKSHTERWHNHQLVHERNSNEHKHEYVHFDYRTNNR